MSLSQCASFMNDHTFSDLWIFRNEFIMREKPYQQIYLDFRFITFARLNSELNSDEWNEFHMRNWNSNWPFSDWINELVDGYSEGSLLLLFAAVRRPTKSLVQYDSAGFSRDWNSSLGSGLVAGLLFTLDGDASNSETFSNATFRSVAWMFMFWKKQKFNDLDWRLKLTYLWN